MRIVLLHHSAPPVVGGVESVLGQQARLMAAAGHEVRIVAGRGERTDVRIPFVSIPLVDSLHPEILAAKESLDRGEVPPAFPHLVEKLVVALSSALAGTDRVIAHNVCSLNKNLALTAALHDLSLRGKPGWMVLWHHDLAWTTPRYQMELHPGQPWDLLRMAWPRARQVTISEFRRAELAQLMDIPAGNIEVVPNGVDPASFLKLEEQTVSLARQVRLFDAQPLLLLPVRITPRKNIEFALRVTGELRKRMPNAVLVVTGPPGPHNPKNAAYLQGLKGLRAQLGLDGSIHFLAETAGGPLPESVVGDLYRLADALLLTSREEGFGIPVLEAGLARLPVFCTDIPPLRELGAGCVEYFALEAKPEDVAATIADRLEGSPVYCLRERVRGHYTWEQIYREKIAPLLAEE